jgi:hypothetical protein
MLTRYLTLAVAGVALTFGGQLAAAEGQAPESEADQQPQDTVEQQATTLEAFIADWPEVSRTAATEMGSHYGTPDGVTPNLLRWTDVGPWTEIIVYREPIPHNFPKPHQDVLEQGVEYDVPEDKFDELAEFDGSVIADRTRGLLAARCDKQAMNYLALNLANDIITDQKTVEEARQYYTDAVTRFAQGEQDPYTQQLTFEVPERAADPGKVTIQGAEAEAQKRG